MPITSAELEDIVAELLTRPGHEKVRGLIYKLLTDGLGAASRDIAFEQQLTVVRGRIDALLGRTVIEVKSDLRREGYEAQLATYLTDKKVQTGRDHVGMATDGADWRVHALLPDGSLDDLGVFQPKLDAPERLLTWIESVVALQDRLPPDVQRIKIELGRESVLYRRALREIEGLWRRLESHPEVALKRQLWDRLLRVAYGTEVQAPGLFLQHTYLVIVAKAVATAALVDRLPDTGEALLDGRLFREDGILGAVEADFFDWLLADPAGDALVLRIAHQAARFDLHAIDSDVLKGLYESLIDPAQRHDLGEYYTPDWLAERVCAAAIERPLDERVIDPACGSGTFLFHAIHRLLAAADAARMPAADAVALVGDRVAGIDVHPVAVIFARATYLLALAPTFQAGRPQTLSVPVYLGDALQWNARELMGVQELEILVPPAVPGGEAAVLRFPEDIVAHPTRFDETIDRMLELAERSRPSSDLAGWLRDQGLGGGAVTMLERTYDLLRQLNEDGRNHIWGYVARNLSRPIWLAGEQQKAHVVVGNPPWVRYSALSRENQERLKAEATRAGVWVGGKAATANDLCAYFYARAVDLYMRREGRIAFVLPYAALSRDPYGKFRRGDFNRWREEPKAVRFTAAWTFPSEVQPLFPVPACVLFGQGQRLPGRLPTRVTRHAGQLPARDVDASTADRCLTAHDDDWPADTGETASPYSSRFKNGATLWPRRLVFVERVAGGRLGSNIQSPRVQSRTSSQDKAPWKHIDALSGPVEADFLKPVLLGESIVPFRIMSHALAVVPWLAEEGVLDADAAYRLGFRHLAGWLTRAEQLWADNSRERMTLSEQLDYFGKLSGQFPLGRLRVVFAKSGTLPAAAITRDRTHVIENRLYWGTVRSVAEGQYLCAILNSETTRSRAERWQSEGQWGKRDFDKAMFNLPIPLFDANHAVHRDLAAAGTHAERIAGLVDVREGEYFTRTRKRVRDALSADGVADEIDALVARLLG